MQIFNFLLKFAVAPLMGCVDWNYTVTANEPLANQKIVVEYPFIAFYWLMRWKFTYRQVNFFRFTVQRVYKNRPDHLNRGGLVVLFGCWFFIGGGCSQFYPVSFHVWYNQVIDIAVQAFSDTFRIGFYFILFAFIYYYS